ncbi:MAG TPA: type IV pilus twitching motility protein PilT [Gemmatimonadaceae bacterium]|jgi:twitching motility protein PilT
MPYLDRFLAAMVTSRADALTLAADDLARMSIANVARPVTKQPLRAAQLRTVLLEVAPPESRDALGAGSDASFTYTFENVTYDVHVVAGPAGQTAEVRPHVAGPAADATAPAAPPAAAAPAAPPAPRLTEREPVAAQRVALPELRTSGAMAIAVEDTDSAPAVSEEIRREIHYLLEQLVSRGASDLHLRVSEPPILRLHGEMARIEGRAPLDNQTLESMMHALMPNRNRREFESINDTDFAYEIENLARFRCNAFRDRRGAAAVFRVIPARVVTADELGLTEEVQRLCHLPRGLVLVTGPTGSGKSTTLCALIDLVNRTRSDHVVTIEDPIEFVHQNKQCIITQRQVGLHTQSFKHALRAALREDPDIILVGELRDLETVSIAIETAETGHLVFGTLHTTSAVSTVDRLIDQFPPDRQAQIRVMLSESLRGVISQVLCKKVGGGRVAAREVLLTIPAVSNLIREGKTFQIPSILQTSKRLGMVTLNDALIDLVDANLVEPRDAYIKASDKHGFAGMLKSRKHDTTFLEGDLAAAGAGGGTGSAPAVKAEGGLKQPGSRPAGAGR